MTDEPVGTGSENATSSDNTEPDKERFTFVFRDPAIVGNIAGRDVIKYVPEQLALVAAASIYSKAFLETLARRHADGLADLVRTRFRKSTVAEIGLNSGATATIIVTEDLPDEARLALLDLDVTADELRGKLLRWDDSTSAWRPAGDQ